VPVDDVLLLDRSPEDEQERSGEGGWAVHAIASNKPSCCPSLPADCRCPTALR
jgi:hypothetical protein